MHLPRICRRAFVEGLPKEGPRGGRQGALDEDAGGVGVVLGAESERGIHEDGEQRVHGADVVQHVVILQHDARHRHQEVEAPHHRRKPVRARSR